MLSIYTVYIVFAIGICQLRQHGQQLIVVFNVSYVLTLMLPASARLGAELYQPGRVAACYPSLRVIR